MYNEGEGEAKISNNKCRQLSLDASLNILSGGVGSVSFLNLTGTCFTRPAL